MSTLSIRRSACVVAPLLLAAAIPLLLSGCEAEAVELAREISAARGDCTTEGLKRSDEECVRMMERYTEMGTELVHTYIGGLRALDMALDRMPAPAFDTAGLGYSISPELREGDAFGEGASPRLLPGAASYGSAAVRRETSYSSAPRQRGAPRANSSARAAERSRGAWDGSQALRPNARRDTRVTEWERNRRSGGSGWRSYDRRQYRPFGYGPSDWWGYGDAYRYLESGPEGYFNSGPYAYFYQRLPGRAYPGGYGYGGAYGHAPGYSYPESYGYDDGYGYYGYSGAYDDYDGYGRSRYDDGRSRYPYDPRYEPGAYGYEGDDPRGYGYEGYGYGANPYAPDYGYRDERPSDVSARSPAEDWAYEPPAAEGDVVDGAEVETAEPTAVPSRPAPHRPGILLPPEERLRRPWLDD